MSVNFISTCPQNSQATNTMQAVNVLLADHPGLSPESIAMAMAHSLPVNIYALMDGSRPLNLEDLKRFGSLSPVKTSPLEQGRLVFAFVADLLGEKWTQVLVDYIRQQPDAEDRAGS